MAGVFRFSNAVSDIDKLIYTFRALVCEFGHLSGDESFDHDQAARFLAKNGLASSLGAIGNEAISRSFSAETTALNPLYNQHKSYSEFFRMMGWYNPTSKQSKFQISDFGKIIGDENLTPEAIKKLIEKCVLHIVSPNPLTNVKGGNILRPFPLLLKLMNRLDGVILRDEIILSVLACENDNVSNIVETQVQYIKQIRSKGYNVLEKEVLDLRAKNGGYHFKTIDGEKCRVFAPLGKDTLPNYTRLPLALCKWLGWATEVNMKGIYGNKTVHALKITPYGEFLANQLETCKDIRYADLEQFSEDAIVAFTAYSNLFHLEVAFDTFNDYKEELQKIIDLALPIFNHYNIVPFEDLFLFFGYQESPLNICTKSDNLIDQV